MRAACSSVGRVRRGGLIRVSVVRAHPGELSSEFELWRKRTGTSGRFAEAQAC